ncbi:hypothetical protein WOLCODRAFT_109340 [Wolfiporia cocos MD-104 SS10]|uniref:DUF1308 domain-containing protein n=1 Tax=Wolfiporia cocos (strain MD-104) TaxID=742152 RepID=A0A2H3J3Y6_WOLCO|nr:hypothetical protein WOLCODRAFT_109340 [Wolfiporia cocos MD-104 SS10]
MQLQDILTGIKNLAPSVAPPPILDSSCIALEKGEDRNESVPGLRSLRDAVRRDLDVLERFLDDPRNAHLPPLSTNAPYLIAVWSEVLHAPPPVLSIWQTYYDRAQTGMSRKRGSQKPPGVKIDILADSGRRWIRINTTKNSRMLAELREIDSYMTDSEDSEDPEADTLPSLAQTQFDNSLLKMGRELLAAAKQNPIPGTEETPTVTLRLTRLDPSPSDEKEHDPRIAKTIQELQIMGIDVQIGERDFFAAAEQAATRSSRAVSLEPTIHVNLDLSILIALVSDITHSPLPQSAEEAALRFVPPPEYREWKKKHIEATKGLDAAAWLDDADVEDGGGKHSRALAAQAVQEMRRGLLQEIHDRLTSLVRRPSDEDSTSSSCSQSDFSAVQFWTTPEARDRCLQIVLSKIGGPSEKRRVEALFPAHASLPMTAEEAEEAYWRDSRYPRGFLPLLPIKVYPTSEPDMALEPPSHARGEGGAAEGAPLSPFFGQLAQTCRDVLAQQTIPLTRANPKLTAHTVQSLLWGAVRGWTTLTANKASVKAILREVKAARMSHGWAWNAAEAHEAGAQKAALWVVDPRSLAEGMRSDLMSP